MTCRTLLLAHTRMAQPLAWSGGSLCVAYARASMPRVPRGPRRPPRHAWHRLVRPNLAAPATTSLSAIIAGPSMAAGAAGEAAGGRGNKNTIAFKRSRTRIGCNKPNTRMHTPHAAGKRGGCGKAAQRKAPVARKANGDTAQKYLGYDLVTNYIDPLRTYSTKVKKGGITKKTTQGSSKGQSVNAAKNSL